MHCLVNSQCSYFLCAFSQNEIIFVGLALGLRPNCGMLVYANGSCVELPRPFGGTVSNQQTVSNHLPEPSARWCKTKPTPCASFTAVKPNQTFFLLCQSASSLFSLHCVALNAIGFGVPCPDFGVTRSLISPSKASKGMAPVVKLT